MTYPIGQTGIMYEPITLEELQGADLESPILHCEALEVDAFEQLYALAVKQVEEEFPLQAKVFRLLATICSFHFRPSDKAEPFDCHINFGDGRRTLIGSDFSKDEIEALGQQTGRIQNLALRTRVADLVWSRDKSRPELGREANRGYVELITLLNSGKGKLRFERDARNSIAVQNYLVRAISIARTIGWHKAENDPLRVVAQACLESAAVESGMALVRFGGIVADLRLETSAEILDGLDEVAEKLANSGDLHSAEEVEKLSIRRARMQRNNAVVRERSIKLAKLLVRRAEGGDSAFLKSHALQEAYAALQGVKGVRDERAKIHELLKESQIHMYEEMGQFEESFDISHEVKHFRSLFYDLDLLESLRTLSLIELPKHPDKLEAEARELTAKYPLSSLFSSSILDGKGRTVAKVEGGARREFRRSSLSGNQE